MMSSESESLDNKSLTARPSDTNLTDQFRCQWDTCMQQFSCVTDLAHHIDKTHMLKGVIWKEYACLWRSCPKNKKDFNFRYLLVEHLRTHSGEKPHRCPYQGCDKAFARLGCFNLHVQRQHIGEKHYKCQIQGCNKSFFTSSERSLHQKTHFKQRKPFACTFPGCDKTYTYHHTLKKHIIDKHKEGKKTSIPLIAEPPQLHPDHAHTDNSYLQRPFPEAMVGLPYVNTIFDAQGLGNYLPDNSLLQTQSNILLQSSKLSSLSSHHNHLVMPSMTSSINVHSHPQSIYKQCIPSHLPPYEDIQSMHYMSPLQCPTNYR